MRTICYRIGMPTAMRRLMLGFALPAATWACSCMGGGPPCASALGSSAVFTGRVMDVTRDPPQPDGSGSRRITGFPGTHVTFEVTEAFVGMERRGKQIEIRTAMGGGDCGYPFEVGRSYLVYAFEDQQGLLVTNICSRTAETERAEADLAYLRSLPSREPYGYVYGMAGNAETEGQFDQTLRTWIPSGLSGVTVTLTGPIKSRQQITGDDGSFRFDRLPPGKYEVAVAKDGYRRYFRSRMLNVHAGGCGYSLETLVVDRRIVGTVTAADGRPASDIQVELVPAHPTERMSLPFPAAHAKTGSDGTYALEDVRQGEYYLGINLASSPSKEMPYSRYFYPGTADPTRAAVVVIGPGPGTSTYHFPIPAPQKARLVNGTVRWPVGLPAGNAEILLEDVRWPWRTSVVLARTDIFGRFEVTVFDETEYRVHAVAKAWLTNESVSAEPSRIRPGMDLSKPLRLILTRKGHSAAELTGTGLERWRAGLGF